MRGERPCRLAKCHFLTAHLLVLLLTWMAPQGVHAEPRSLYIYGSLSTEYSAELAQFGNPMDRSFPANLMLPPDNPWLCEYPASLANLTKAEIASKPEFFFNQNVALFVSINRCSAETKARVAAQLAERISDKIKMIILYSTNPQEFKFVSLKADKEDNPPDLQNIGVLYIPHRYASGIDLRMRMQYQGDDPRFGWESSERWHFPIEVTAFSAGSRTRRGDTSGYNGGDIYWFRIILFSLLIASPCCRACYLWYAGGGRLHWRRNDRGRIVGIQYIPPMPLWLTTGRPPHDGPTPVGVLTEEEFNSLPEIVYTGIPEKDPFDSDHEEEGNDNGDGDGGDGTVGGNPHTWSNAEVKSGTEEFTATGSDLPASDVDVESGEVVTSHANNGDESAPEPSSSEGNSTSDETEKSNQNAASDGLKDGEFLGKSDETSDEKVVIGQGDDFLKTSPEQKSSSEAATEHETALMASSLSQLPEEEIVFNGESADGSSPSSSDSEEGQDETVGLLSSETEGGEQLGNPPEKNSSKQAPTAPDANASIENPPTGTNDSDVQAVEPAEGNDNESGSGDKQTTSTACAICIDEFETGERLTLLPRCKHAFHRECIHAWLIERQGCCPLCKTDVLEPDPNNSPGELDLEAPAEQRFMISSM